MVGGDAPQDVIDTALMLIYLYVGILKLSVFSLELLLALRQLLLIRLALHFDLPDQ